MLSASLDFNIPNVMYVKFSVHRDDNKVIVIHESSMNWAASSDLLGAVGLSMTENCFNYIKNQISRVWSLEDTKRLLKVTARRK